MRSRAGVLVGVVVTVLSATGLAIYFARVGLDRADKLASVLGTFVGLVGLAMAAYGLLQGRKSPPRADVPIVPATNAVQGPATVKNEIRGPVQGSAIQAGTISGSVTINDPTPKHQETPPDSI